MPKPRIFLSSTCYDLSTIRSELDSFLEDYGFEVLNSEKGSFGVTPGKHSHSASIEQVENADFMILIIGRRRGGTFIASEKSITNEEFMTAMKRGIPVVIFVDKLVRGSLPLFSKNPSGDFSAVVDDIRIFDFVKYISASANDNWLFDYETIADMRGTLKAQFAHYLHLFSQDLQRKVGGQKSAPSQRLTSVEFPHNLDRLTGMGFDQQEETALRNGLRQLHKLMRSILTSEGKTDGKREKMKCIWVLGRYGNVGHSGISISENQFKDYAWSTFKGKRVFEQMLPFGIHGEYDADEHDQVMRIYLHFDGEGADATVAGALAHWVEQLLAANDSDAAFELFCKIDMRIYAK